MSEKIRTTVSLHPGIMEKARTMMSEDSFSDFSGYLEQVIRDKWQQRQIQLQDAPPTQPLPAAEPATYTKKSKPRRANN